jgi:hypothetical protein
VKEKGSVISLMSTLFCAGMRRHCWVTHRNKISRRKLILVFPYDVDELRVDGWTNLTSMKWTWNIKSLLRKKITIID